MPQRTAGDRRSPKVGGSKAPRSLATPAPKSAYRGARQGLPGCPTRICPRCQAAHDPNPRKQAQNALPLGPLSPASNLPGCPTKTTGVPDKNYRGPQQTPPGRPTKTTGAPDKWFSIKLLQNGVFRVVFSGAFVFVYLVVLCCLT